MTLCIILENLTKSMTVNPVLTNGVKNVTHWTPLVTYREEINGYSYTFILHFFVHHFRPFSIRYNYILGCLHESRLNYNSFRTELVPFLNSNTRAKISCRPGSYKRG